MFTNTFTCITIAIEPLKFLESEVKLITFLIVKLGLSLFTYKFECIKTAKDIFIILKMKSK